LSAKERERLRVLEQSVRNREEKRHAQSGELLGFDQGEFAVADLLDEFWAFFLISCALRSLRSESLASLEVSFCRPSLEAGFELPCLNHACDPATKVMSDLFAGDDR